MQLVVTTYHDLYFIEVFATWDRLCEKCVLAAVRVRIHTTRGTFPLLMVTLLKYHP